MKLHKLKKSKFPNLELQIIKQFRNKKELTLIFGIKLIKTLFNKIANVIYLHHVTGKTILFLGFPTNFSKILKTTKHLLVPEFMWQNNMLSNNTNLSNKDRKTKIPQNVLKLKTKLRKKVDLIIVNNVDKNKMVLKESYLAQIPAIILTEDLDIAKLRSSYSSTGSYNFFAEKEGNKNFFFLFLKSVLLRAKKCNKKTNTAAFFTLHDQTNLKVKSSNAKTNDQSFKNKKI